MRYQQSDLSYLILWKLVSGRIPADYFLYITCDHLDDREPHMPQTGGTWTWTWSNSLEHAHSTGTAPQHNMAHAHATLTG